MSGLGGWGDPNADFSVPDGGFRNFHISYPSPHIVRRNFTLLSFNLPFPLMTDKQKMGNTSFTASVIDAILETSAGDYKGFQVPLEAPEVRKMDASNVSRVSSPLVTSGPAQWRARDRGRVSCFIVVYALVLTSTSHLSRRLVIWWECAQQTPHQIARKGPRGHRMVCVHTLNDLSPWVDIDTLYRSTFLFASCSKWTRTNYLMEMALRTLCSMTDDR